MIRSASPPQRSPLPTGAETGRHVRTPRADDHASTKSAPHRSGDSRRPRSDPPSWTCLNEVRSPQERRQRVLHHALDQPFASTKSAPHRSGDRRIAAGLPRPLPGSLNEVRSPQERRRADPSGVVRQEHASTKSAPHRSGDSPMLAGSARSTVVPQRSPLPTGAETAPSAFVVRPTGSPQRSPLPTGAETAFPAASLTRCRNWPQRSPLPTGAETMASR